MLILERRPEEAIIINRGQIRILVLEVNGQRVRLGIDAPLEMPVHREEVEMAIRREEGKCQ